MKKTITLALVTAALAVAPAFAFPPGHHGPHRGPGGPMLGPHALPMLAEALDLTQAQRDQIEALFEEYAPEPVPESVREQVRGLREDLHALWQAESPDRAAILSKMDEMDALREQQRDTRRERRVDLRLALLEVLTPEQRAELLELREEMRSQRPCVGEGPGEERPRGGRGGRHHGRARQGAY